MPKEVMCLVDTAIPYRCVDLLTSSRRALALLMPLHHKEAQRQCGLQPQVVLLTQESS